MKGFYYLPCPLCQQDIKVKQPGRFYILPLHPAYSKLFSHNNWQLKNHSVITIQGLWLSRTETYPTLAYRQRSFLIHWRCYQIVEELSPSQLCLLIDVVEPTFLSRTLPPPSPHGAFCPPDTIPLQCDLENQNTKTEERHTERWLGWRIHRLPLEIQGKILEYNIGRLLYVMRAAAQLSTKNESFRAVSEHRLSEKKVIVYDNMVRIHLVIIGGRTYIGDITSTSNLEHIPQENLSISYSRTLKHIALGFVPAFLLYVFVQKWKSAYVPLLVMIALGFMLYPPAGLAVLNSMHNGIDQKMSRDYRLNECEYLAIKSDETGVIDIAFQQHQAGSKWILNTHTYPFQGKISVIRCADTHNLRIIRDSMKCRAIIPLNRTGAEPYFCSQSAPPQDCWVDSGFPVESTLTLSSAPFAYFTHASYIPFATMKNICFTVEPQQLGITNIAVNISNPGNKCYSVCFPHPPRSLRYTLCGITVVQHTFQYPYLQFEINGHWRPPFPPHCIYLEGPILVENVSGIWWGKTFAFIPLHIGVVVSNKANLKNTVV